MNYKLLIIQNKMGCVSATDPKKQQIAHKNQAAKTQIKNNPTVSDLTIAQPNTNKTQLKYPDHPYAATSPQHQNPNHSAIETKPIDHQAVAHSAIHQTQSKYEDKQHVNPTLDHNNRPLSELQNQHQTSPQHIQDEIPKPNSVQYANSSSLQLNLHSKHDSKKGDQLEQTIEKAGSNISKGIKQVDRHLQYSSTEHKYINIIRPAQKHDEINQDHIEQNGHSAIHLSKESRKRQNNVGDSHYRQNQNGSAIQQERQNQNGSAIQQEPQEQMHNQQYLEHINFYFKLPEIKLVFQAQA